jgi:hypothetical protein
MTASGLRLGRSFFLYALGLILFPHSSGLKARNLIAWGEAERVTGQTDLSSPERVKHSLVPMLRKGRRLSMNRSIFNPKGWQTVAGGRSDSGDLRRRLGNNSTPKAVAVRQDWGEGGRRPGEGFGSWFQCMNHEVLTLQQTAERFSPWGEGLPCSFRTCETSEPGLLS